MADTNFAYVTQASSQSFVAHSTTGKTVGVTSNLRSAQLLIENAYTSGTRIRWVRQVDAAGIERWILLIGDATLPVMAKMALAAAVKPSGERTKIKFPLVPGLWARKKPT